MEARRVLIVANQTAGGSHLREMLVRKMQEGPCRFTLLVPSSPSPDGVLWTEGQAHAAAEERMKEALEGLRELGADIRGVVGDARPIHAIADALAEEPQDEIIVSTFPVGVSRWLKQDLPHRVQRVFRLPTTHVVAEPARRS